MDGDPVTSRLNLPGEAPALGRKRRASDIGPAGKQAAVFDPIVSSRLCLARMRRSTSARRWKPDLYGEEKNIRSAPTRGGTGHHAR